MYKLVIWTNNNILKIFWFWQNAKKQFFLFFILITSSSDRILVCKINFQFFQFLINISFSIIKIVNPFSINIISKLRMLSVIVNRTIIRGISKSFNKFSRDTAVILNSCINYFISFGKLIF